MVHLAQTVHLATSRLALFQTGQNELPLETRHLGVPSGMSEPISRPMVRLTQMVHLSYVTISTIYKETEMSFT
jgi:hypothetical protein